MPANGQPESVPEPLNTQIFSTLCNPYHNRLVTSGVAAPQHLYCEACMAAECCMWKQSWLVNDQRPPYMLHTDCHEISCLVRCAEKLVHALACQDCSSAVTSSQLILFHLLSCRLSKHGHGEYALPGGHLEYKESFEECARREVAEETGLQLQLEHIKYAWAVNSVFPNNGSHYVTIFMRTQVPWERLVPYIC